MAKSFIDVVHDSPRTGLGIPVKTKNPLFRTNTPPAEPSFGFELRGQLVPAWSRVRLFRHSFARDSYPRPHAHQANRLVAPTRGGIKRFVPRTKRTAKSGQDAGQRVQAPTQFLLALVVAALRTPIMLPRLHHQGDEWLDKHPFLFRLEHEGDYRVRSELCAHCPTDSLPGHASPGAHKKCVLCIVHKGSAVATRLIVSFFEALQVRIKATMARKPPSRERFPADWLSRWAPYGAERSPSFPPPISLLVGCSPGPAQYSSTQFCMLRQFSAPHLSVPRTASSG